MSAYETLKNIFKVIYRPHKVFKEISQNPKFIGPILIIILFIPAITGFIYIIMSKSYIEQTLPPAEQRDKWTENATFWKASLGVTPTDNYVDYVNGTYYGDKSIEFSVVNSRQILLELDDIGPIDCLGPDGYQNVSFRIKQINSNTEPLNATFYLFSATSEYFYYDLKEKLFNYTINAWNNVTLPLGSNGWLSSSINADWRNITGLRLKLIWPHDLNVTLLMDGLFFRGIFKNQIEIFGAGILFNFITEFIMQYVVLWVILSGLLYIVMKGFRRKSAWRPLLICVGFVLITLVVQNLIYIAAQATLPARHYSLELLGGVEGEIEDAYLQIWEKVWIVYTFSRYLQITIYMWIVGLCGIAVHSLIEFSWPKSLFISTVAFLITFLILGVLFPYLNLLTIGFLT